MLKSFRWFCIIIMLRGQHPVAKKIYVYEFYYICLHDVPLFAYVFSWFSSKTDFICFQMWWDNVWTGPDSIKKAPNQAQMLQAPINLKADEICFGLNKFPRKLTNFLRFFFFCLKENKLIHYWNQGLLHNKSKEN